MAFTPKYNLIEELKWRGLFHQDTPGIEDLLKQELVKGYIGFDPTADSLHIGNMVPIILLVHLQKSGHKPIALVGGATGMVGDPSGKKAERKLLDEETINHNLECQKKQLMQFLDFETVGDNKAEIVNNYDWFKNFGFLEFIRDVGKHISVNYMMAKDSVKNRLVSGMSFTEFTYQLVQGYDFYFLWKELGVKLQMGGSDQWGNIVTGTELIRRKGQGEGYAITAPLITKADGSKFGKSEGGNVWLDSEKTSPYEFYQFWINTTDEDAERYIKIFTLLDKQDIEQRIAAHKENPGFNQLQKDLAHYVTAWVHGEAEANKARELSQILFKKGNAESLKSLNERDILAICQGLEQVELNQPEEEVTEFLNSTGFFKSKSDVGRALKGNAISINKSKIDAAYTIANEDWLLGKYMLIQNGKKNFYLAIKK
jgi:tyrosyl-tRNA synthetase